MLKVLEVKNLYTFNSTLVHWKFIAVRNFRILGTVFQFYTSSLEIIFPDAPIPLMPNDFQFYTSSLEIWRIRCGQNLKRCFTFNSTLVHWKFDLIRSKVRANINIFQFYTSSLEMGSI